jgi:hypothetical protein
MELLTCTRCDGQKEASLKFFPPHNKKKNGLDSWCRTCRNGYRSEIRRGNYRKMGCDDVTLKNLLSSKECTICGEITNKLSVDHCHKTNKVRGILCQECNLGLGKFKDDPELLEFARIYLLAFHDAPEAIDYLEVNS